jgi:hypothetical protein
VLAPCNRRHNSAAAPMIATMRAKIAEKLMSFPSLIARTLSDTNAR